MMQIFSTYNKFNWHIIGLFLFVIFSDLLTSIWLLDEFNYSFLVKGFVILYVLFYVERKLIWFLCLSYLLISIGVIFNYQEDVIKRTALFFEYFSGILIFNYFIKYNSTESIKKLVSIIFLFYILTIIIAFVFQIESFKTYANRFGFMPLFSSQNEFSFIMIAAIMYFYNKLIYNKNLFNYFLLGLSIIAASIVGTKVLYLFIFMFINALIYKKIKLKKYILFVVIIIGLNLIFLDVWREIINDNFSYFANFYKEHGLLNTVSSFRVSYLQNRLTCQIANFEIINYFFGGSVLSCITEMSLIDIFLFFGIIGVFLYGYMYKIFIFNYLKLDFIGYFFILSTALLSFLAGYFFENFSAQFYFMSVLYVYYHKAAVNK